MRITTTLTTVMFALLIGMLSTQSADAHAGNIRKGVVKRGESVTYCATGVPTEGGTALLTTVPSGSLLVCQNVCTVDTDGDALINGCTQGEENLKVGESCATLTKPGQTFGPGSLIFRNDSTDKSVNVRIDCILTR